MQKPSTTVVTIGEVASGRQQLRLLAEVQYTVFSDERYVTRVFGFVQLRCPFGHCKKGSFGISGDSRDQKRKRTADEHG